MIYLAQSPNYGCLVHIIAIRYNIILLVLSVCPLNAAAYVMPASHLNSCFFSLDVSIVYQKSRIENKIGYFENVYWNYTTAIKCQNLSLISRTEFTFLVVVAIVDANTAAKYQQRRHSKICFASTSSWSQANDIIFC